MNVLSIFRMLIIAVILSVCVPAMAEVHGVLRVVKGDVQIKSGQTGETAKAKLGQEVYPKDTIITGKDARAKVVMIDNNELNISPESHVEIQNYEYNPVQNKKDVLLNVLYGKVRSKVEQKYDGKTSKFQVKTPSAVAGVRGTDFVTGYTPATKQSQVVTFRGAVEFGTPGPNGTIANAVSVTPGKMASSTAGGAPTAPANVPKDQLAKMDHESKADSNAKGSSEDSKTPTQDSKGDKGDKSKGDGKSGGGASNGASGNGGNSSGPSASGNGSSGSAAGGAASGGSGVAAAASDSSGGSSSGSSSNSGGSASGSSTASAGSGGSSGSSGGSGGAASSDSSGGSSGSSSTSSGGSTSGGSTVSSGGGSSSGGSVTAGGDSSGGREPASTAAGSTAGGSTGGGATGAGSGSMITTSDLASGSNNLVANIPKAPSVVTVAPPLPAAPPVTPTTCTFCNQIIQSGNSKITVHVAP